jgi:hypothetical protein
MYRNERARCHSFEDRQSEVLQIIADYRFAAPRALAAREHLATELTRYAAVRDGGPEKEPGLGVARRWLGARVVQLGSWIGGATIRPSARPLAPNSVPVR